MSMGEWLRAKLPDQVDVGAMLDEKRFVTADGTPLRSGDPYTPHTFVWFHRDLRPEPAVPGEITVLHRDERLVVVDKPHFLSTIPRGRHVAQSVVVRVRADLGLPELAPVHRLDRATAGVLLLTTERRWRGPYQSMFEQRAVTKTYRALAPYRSDVRLPTTVRSHLVKRRGSLQVETMPDLPPNAETLVELEAVLGERAVYRLHPTTGRTHQLRVHLAGLGLPIVGDPLYPEVRDVEADDFADPLQLVAHELAFLDPVDGRPRRFVSRRDLVLR
jgi:tRNA pseudouridine32 synthase/23S rRNA pseudouridine746 synthase